MLMKAKSRLRPVAGRNGDWVFAGAGAASVSQQPVSSARRFEQALDRGAAHQSPAAVPEIKVSLLTGGLDKPYVMGLTAALVSHGVSLEVIGNSTLDGPEMHSTGQLSFLSLYWNPLKNLSAAAKLWRVFLSYVRIAFYAARAQPKIFHVLWNNKFELFDRTILMLYHKALGKKVVFTAHNVNAGKRDSNDSAFNRLTLKIQYRLADHIFVHTPRMKAELRDDFGVSEHAVTVIPFGINDSMPSTNLTRGEARQRLGLREDDRTILFFGNVRPYKGLEYLVEAFNLLGDDHYRLIIAGEPKKDTAVYMRQIEDAIERAGSRSRIIEKLEFVADDQAELYFKASDVAVLPYTVVFQSGVLFTAYSYGLPVIATDVGSLSEDIAPGETGLLCRARDAEDLARAIREYFESDLYRTLDSRRQGIRNYALARHSWDEVGELTRKVYADLLAANR
jgi:glycosyltransferase involved in cell wall biosynthesis